MVRCNGVASNQISPLFSSEFDPDFEAVFEELELWSDVLKDHRHELRGPRP